MSSLAPKCLVRAFTNDSWYISDPAGPDNNTRWQREDICCVHLMDSLQHKFTYAEDRRAFL
ncbi:hypothetical protein L9G16_22040, partial [Shewanella sp. A25]|nr:hypothetical protein [Shewanella shenzhenensis]